MVDQGAAQEGALHPTAELLPFKRRIALLGFRLGRVNHEALVRVDQRDVGVEARCDIALVEQAEPPRRVPGQKLGHAIVGHAALAALAHHAGEQILGAAESRLGEPDIARVVLRPLLLARTAGVIADDPINLAVEYGLPQRLDVLARPDRRIDLGVHRAFAVGIQQQVSHRDLAAERDVRKDLLHGPGRVHRLARAQVQQVDVEAIRLIGEIGRDPDRQPLRVWRAGGAVGMQPGELALAFDDLGVGVEDLRELAVQADADVIRKFRMLRHQSPGGAHDEFEMRDVVAFLRADH